MTKSKAEQIVDDVEETLAASHECPYCGIYDGTHRVTCEYLKHKGNVDAARRGMGKAVKVEKTIIEKESGETGAEEEKSETENKISQAELLEKMKLTNKK